MRGWLYILAASAVFLEDHFYPSKNCKNKGACCDYFMKTEHATDKIVNPENSSKVFVKSETKLQKPLYKYNTICIPCLNLLRIEKLVDPEVTKFDASITGIKGQSYLDPGFVAKNKNNLYKCYIQVTIEEPKLDLLVLKNTQTLHIEFANLVQTSKYLPDSGNETDPQDYFMPPGKYSAGIVGKLDAILKMLGKQKFSDKIENAHWRVSAVPATSICCIFPESCRAHKIKASSFLHPYAGKCLFEQYRDALPSRFPGHGTACNEKITNQTVLADL
ncbi:hypothetical protein ENBRE01_1535 [Enteropsectra breve]|nr:hypothetical protein ENBRE01_1535 [Enteropsectra breve]